MSSNIFEMALEDYELNLQTEIVSWKCSRHADCNMKFIGKRRHIKLGMGPLVWSIEALPLQNPTQYSFIIMDVKRSEAAAPNLAAKFELLIAGYKAAVNTVHKVEEALDKLYEFSRLFALAERNRRWEIVLDAQITATACESAKAAVHEAAQAAAALLGDQLGDQVQDRSLFLIGEEQIVSCERSGWWIDKWTVEDELWAASFFSRDSWRCMMRAIQADAVERGSDVQWCTVRIFHQPNPNFQFEVAVNEFLDGDYSLLRVGVANDRGLTVRVFLTEGLEVVCSQKGIESRTSLGLAYLLPELVKDYIRCALGQNEDDLRNKNVVQGVIEHLISYLASLGRICLICRKKKPFYAAWKSTCSDMMCKARKQRYKDAIAAFLPAAKMLDKERARRREHYVIRLYPNSKEGRNGLSVLLNSDVLGDEESKGHCNEDAVYIEAVDRVTKMVSINFLI